MYMPTPREILLLLYGFFGFASLGGVLNICVASAGLKKVGGGKFVSAIFRGSLAASENGAGLNVF